MAKKPTKSTVAKPAAKIDAVRHKDKRRNIPTEELRDFVREDESQPKTMHYPRNPDLDPQLVWKGKDEQDREPLEVPVVPIYIQEKVHPQAIVEDFRRTAAKASADDPQFNLYADFNGLPEDFDKRVDFYHHEGHWSNRLILGDSLLVMTSLAEKEALKGKVQMVFFDPPYGIKFGSNWQVSTRKRDVKDGKAEDVVRQPEQIKAFRDTWTLGVHSYLTYLRDRFVAAHQLLTETGAIFVQIGDENVHLVRSVLDEVFGSDNFVAQITFAKTGGSTREYLSGTCDFLLLFAKNRPTLKFRQPYVAKTVETESSGPYGMIRMQDGSQRRMTPEERVNPKLLPSDAAVFRMDNLQSQSIGREKGEGASCWFPVPFEGREWLPNARSRWKTNETGMQNLLSADRLVATGTGLYYVRYINDFPAAPVADNWTDTVVAGFASDKHYVVETSTKVVERCIIMTTDPGDLVLDPTCGSGTTAFVAEQWGRRWITIDSSRVALTLARTRMMASRFPFYLLTDSDEGVVKEAEIKGQVPPTPKPKTEGDVRKGFVYKRVPHITLKSIANNDEIAAIHAEWQPKIEKALKEVNRLLKASYAEWDVPRVPADDDATGWKAMPKGVTLGSEAANALARYWQIRSDRQKQIDDSIAQHGESEILYDQPYEDNKRVRVTGPFTVESLSPHRTISVEDKRELAQPNEDGWSMKMLAGDNFSNMILDNLRTAGVQNTIKNQRLKFDSIEVFAGQWLHGDARFTESDGKPKRAAICIGPEHGTVGAQLVKEAAKEAVRGVGFDMLIVCGFAFDPSVSEEAKRYGNLTVLAVRMNPDLNMGDLLKKTGAANLFMVFGEPDLDVTKQKDGQIIVEIRGLDVYDPTTGEVRSNSTDEIACWFIDTNYNGESFFVRHAYFTGADEPYEKLKRALRAEIDEAAWSALYTTKSRPFASPDTGKIAVKVINHFGDEVLKVYDVRSG